jgi:hypothetical protein
MIFIIYVRCQIEELLSSAALSKKTVYIFKKLNYKQLLSQLI